MFYSPWAVGQSAWPPQRSQMVHLIRYHFKGNTPNVGLLFTTLPAQERSSTTQPKQFSVPFLLSFLWSTPHILLVSDQAPSYLFFPFVQVSSCKLSNHFGYTSCGCRVVSSAPHPSPQFFFTIQSTGVSWSIGVISPVFVWFCES